MTTCTACGHEARDGVRFCEECGEAFDAAADAAGETVSVDPVDEAPAVDSGVAADPAAVDVPIDAEVSILTDEPLTTVRRESSAPQPTEVTLRIVRQPAVVWWAVAALGFAVFFPWLTTPLRINNAMGVPVEFLWSRSAPTDGLSLGWILLAVALVGAIASVASILAIVRRLAGLVAVVASISLVVQWVQVLDRADSPDHWLSFIGVGVYTAFAAGVVLLLAPSRVKA